jgi:hypothetical protein
MKTKKTKKPIDDKEDLLPTVYFGRYREDPYVDWRKRNIVDNVNEENLPTRPYVLAVLGFDPDEEFKEEKVKKGSKGKTKDSNPSRRRKNAKS